MKSLLRLFLSLAILGALSTQSFAQQTSDTTLISRPRYFGLFFDWNQGFSPKTIIYYDEAPGRIGISLMSREYSSSMRLGLLYTVPFMKYFEAEIRGSLSCYPLHAMYAQVITLTNDTPKRAETYSFFAEREYPVSVEVQGTMSYEWYRKRRVALLGSVSGWLLAGEQKMPGYCGGEAGITSYIQLHGHSAVQLKNLYGYSAFGWYTRFSVAICYQGRRIMRAHPDKYYIRTYSEGE